MLSEGMVAERETLNKIRSLLKFHPRGLTISDISQRFKLNRNSVAKYLEILELSGCVEMRHMGAAKVFYLSQRIPLASILGFTKEGIIVINEEGRIVQVNERFCQMFDLNQNEVLSAQITTLPQNLIKILTSPQLLDDQEKKAEMTRVLCINQYDWTQYYKVRILNTIFDTGDSGKTVIIEDITLEKEMENRLRINEARYQCIIEDQIEMICRFTPDGKITFANDAFCRNMSIEPAQISGQSIRQFLPFDCFTQIETGMQNSTPENPVWDLEIEMSLHSGERCWQHWIYRGIFDDSAVALEFQGVGRDISERKRDEIELLIKSHAIESSIMPICLLSLEGIITYINPAFIEMWGYNNPNELIGHPIENLAHGDLEALKNIFLIRHIASKESNYRGEVSAIKKTGENLNLLISASIVRDNTDNPLCVISYFNDVTGLARMKSEVRMKDTAISHTYEGLAIICPKGKIRYVNPSFYRLFQKIPDGILLGKQIDEIFSYYPQLAWKSDEIYKTLNQTGTFESVISDISDDGMTSVILINLSNEKDNKNNQLCTVFSATDITQQRLIEESLSMMYHHLEKAIEHVGDPTFILDNQRNVVAWNYAMASLTGFKREEMIGTSRYHEACKMFEPAIPLLADLIDLPVRELIRQYPHVSRFGSGLFTESFISPFQESKGALIWAKASPIVNTSGQTIGVIQTMKDMTNWKRISEHGQFQTKVM